MGLLGEIVSSGVRPRPHRRSSEACDANDLPKSPLGGEEYSVAGAGRGAELGLPHFAIALGAVSHELQSWRSGAVENGSYAASVRQPHDDAVHTWPYLFAAFHYSATLAGDVQLLRLSQPFDKGLWHLESPGGVAATGLRLKFLAQPPLDPSAVGRKSAHMRGPQLDSPGIKAEGHRVGEWVETRGSLRLELP